MTELAPAIQCKPGQLWYPGLRLDDEYPIPTEDELQALWEEYASDDRQVHTTEGVYGVYSQPADGPISAVVSVDLCEVVRDSAVALDDVTGYHLGRRGMYSKSTWFSPAEMPDDSYEKSVVVSGLQVVMNAGLVRPVEDIEAIGAFLRNWRRNDVYCVANTSTLPGCEPGTIRHTLKRDLDAGFDALLLPRNHDGKGAVTKGQALALLCGQAAISTDALPVVHIDDAEHHLLGFKTAYQHNDRLRLFAPIHTDNAGVAAEMRCESPLEAFVRTDEYLREQGAIA